MLALFFLALDHRLALAQMNRDEWAGEIASSPALRHGTEEKEKPNRKGPETPLLYP
jgi:hypothetical protein